MTAMLANDEMTASPRESEWPLRFVSGPVGALSTAPGWARSHAATLAGQWGMDWIADDAELVVSELVTNVVEQVTRPDGNPVYSADGRLQVFQLGLFCDRRRLLVQVFDHLPGKPEAEIPGRDDESGRGLFLVSALCADWGHFRHLDGKIVWSIVAGDQ